LAPATVRPVDVKRIITPLMQEKPTTGHKVLGIVSRVFRYGVALGIVPSDPCRDLRGVVPPKPKAVHRAALTDPADIGELMWGVANFPFSSVVVRQALRFAALTAARPTEVVMASWKEIDFDAAVWIIPPERMKRGREHRVPLSRQALELLREQKAVAGDRDSPWVFPSPRGRGRSLSVNCRLKRAASDRSRVPQQRPYRPFP
ncbi:MAG: tyrosine-type recombinase/integrase, partial [Desulfovibrio sp.]|nr:tyrosine-type recombinase/integrase [Desulfovibrio sp.]